MNQKRADEFHKCAKAAIEKFKTVKRRDLETKAAVVLKDVFKKKIFIDYVRNGLDKRERITKTLRSHLLYLRMRKYFAVAWNVDRIAKEAWKQIRERAELRGALTV